MSGPGGEPLTPPHRWLPIPRRDLLDVATFRDGVEDFIDQIRGGQYE
jgi:hypothetical protein